MLITRRSPMSGDHTMDLDITPEQLAEFMAPFHPGGRLIQQIFPNLTPAEREFIKTGYTQEDWDKLFPPDEDKSAVP